MRASRPLAIAAAAGLVVLTGCAQEVHPARRADRRGGPRAGKISPEDDAQQRAKGVVAGYFAGADGIFDNPSADPGGATLEAVAEGSAKTVASTRANRLILAERAQTGRSEIGDLTILGAPVKDPALRSVRATFSVRNTFWPSRDGWRLSWFTESKTRC